MSATKQWDISKALAVASLFHFFHNFGKFCVIPFLTIFFRYLGLSPPLVGIVMGIKHIIYVFWAPLCSFVARSNRKRRLLITSSLFLSAGAGLALTFFPPLEKDVVLKYCNVSLPWKDRLTTPAALDFEMFGPDLNTSFVATVAPPTTTTLATSMFTNLSHTTITNSVMKTISASKTLEGSDATDVIAHLSSPTPTSETFTLHQKRLKHVTNSRLPKKKVGISSSKLPARDTTSAQAHQVEGNGSDSPALSPKPNASKHSVHQKKVRDVSVSQSVQEYFLDKEHKTFLIVSGIIIVWAVFAAPLEWTADDSLYEYLDFVDATDRHNNVWFWRYMGACLGSCSIVFLIDNLSCFLIADIPQVYLHFYGYSAFMIITLILSTFYPIYVSKKSEHANKTIKALGLIGSDGRIILLSLTVFLTGAVGSTAHNFLFWQLQDIGSTELYMGASISLALFSEVVLHFFREQLLKAFSFKWTVAFSLGCLAVQFLYYSFLWTPWAVLPIQLLSAFSNGVLFWAVNSQAENVATPGTERSIQLVLHCLSHDCGASIGSFASGFIISSFSLPILYQACCVTLLLWLLVFLLVQPRLPHTKKINYSRLLAADNSDMSDSEDEQERDWLVKAMKDDTKKW
ncbi:major facilitator superfamily domain-containing protein 6-like [Pseudophryne corroboree]|uniref:major facilitator superfamily domain-containing protein 6-like n=1 Tax=Pseudophryne corroboree TaxID=495146 RepID=UPI00308134AB